MVCAYLAAKNCAQITGRRRGSNPQQPFAANDRSKEAIINYKIPTPALVVSEIGRKPLENICELK